MDAYEAKISPRAYDVRRMKELSDELGLRS